MSLISSQPASYSRRYQMIISAVHMVYRLVNSTYNVNELCLRLTRLLCQFVKAHSASIYMLDQGAKEKLALIAIFDNKINILIDKKKELLEVTHKELAVTQGQAVVEKRLIGLPLIADESIGAIFVRRSLREPAFTPFDKDMISVFAEQSVTAIKNLQLYEQQQATILSSIKFIDKLFAKRGHETAKHTPVYFKIVKALAERLHVGERGIEALYYATVLHDAGTLDIPYEILSKTERLTPDEFKIIRDLPAKSAELIRPVEFLRPVLPIILYHREKYDGTGYPSGLKRDQIPLGARILAVVDAFESMLRGRPYKNQLTMEQSLEEIKRNSGTQFDPKVVKVFCDLYFQKKFRNYLSHLK